MHLSELDAALLASLVAQTNDDNAGAGGSIVSLLILLLIPFGMYFLLIRPQRRRAREQQALQKSIAVGDEVLTTSGIYGFITAIEADSDVIWVEIDDDVQIRLTRGAISGKVHASPSAPVAAAEADAPSNDTPSTDVDASTPEAPAAGRGTASKRPSLKGTNSASTEGTTTPEPVDE
jgi:preprotein translocase subunit YajC